MTVRSSTRKDILASELPACPSLAMGIFGSSGRKARPHCSRLCVSSGQAAGAVCLRTLPTSGSLLVSRVRPAPSSSTRDLPTEESTSSRQQWRNPSEVALDPWSLAGRQLARFMLCLSNPTCKPLKQNPHAATAEGQDEVQRIRQCSSSNRGSNRQSIADHRSILPSFFPNTETVRQQQRTCLPRKHDVFCTYPFSNTGTP